MLDAIAAAILLVFVALGARRGALGAGLSITVLAASYAAAIGAATQLGTPLAEHLGTSTLLAGPLVGTVAFAASFGLLGAVSRMWVRRERERRGDEPRSALDRLGGGLFGAVRGALLVVLVGWLGLWLDAAQSLRNPGGASRIAESSAVGRVTQKLVKAGAEAALSGAGGGGMASRLLAQPRQTLGGLQTLVEDPRVVRLGQDQSFWTYVEHGAVDAALNQASFYRILHDARLRRELAQIGVISEAAAAEPATFRHEAKQVLAELGPRLRRMREGPELEELARDPEVAALVEQGNVLGLMGHPAFQRVMSRALADAPEPG